MGRTKGKGVSQRFYDSCGVPAACLYSSRTEVVQGTANKGRDRRVYVEECDAPGESFPPVRSRRFRAESQNCKDGDMEEVSGIVWWWEQRKAKRRPGTNGGWRSGHTTVLGVDETRMGEGEKASSRQATGLDCREQPIKTRKCWPTGLH